MALDPEGYPRFWGEAGHIGRNKVRALLRRHGSTHFAIAKWNSPLKPFEGMIRSALKGTCRDSPVIPHSPQVVALVHTAGAFAILSFIVVHVYMITTGHTLFAHTRAMITGWEEVTDEESVGDWEYKTKAA